MSLLGKKWNIKNTDPNKAVSEKILINRGLKTKSAVDNFLKLSFKKGVHNPFLMKDMDKAVARIVDAIKNEERIMIFGDYDVDGVSGTAIVIQTIKLMGGKVSYRLPHRVEHGYGLNKDFIEEFAKLNVNLIITVDCGISCKEEVDLANEKGMDVIITDHHSIPEIFPDKAYAILHPLQPKCSYPFKGLTGAGVAYKLACALITDQYASIDRETYINDILDLASLGTVADLGPLIDENRIIVKYGLQALQNTKWYGLNSLKECAGIEPGAKVDINTIGFRLGPRINAAGRIASPYYALQLLLYDKWDEKAKILADHLEKLNQKRQQMVAEALEEVEKYFAAQEKSKILMAWNKNWHAGILGLLAAKCVEKHMQPAIIMQDFGDYLVGSGRSPESFNMVEALSAHSGLLKSFGGHVQAAGFTIEKDKLEDFLNAMDDYAHEKLDHSDWKPTIDIDCEIHKNDINDRLMDFLEKMEPFGIGNEQPVFLIRDLVPENIKQVGKDMNHLRFDVRNAHDQISVIAFKLGQFDRYLKDQESIDLVCYLEKNEWKGVEKIQLRAIDLKRSECLNPNFPDHNNREHRAGLSPQHQAQLGIKLSL